jgi:hypothetical protein
MLYHHGLYSKCFQNCGYLKRSTCVHHAQITLGKIFAKWTAATIRECSCSSVIMIAEVLLAWWVTPRFLQDRHSIKIKNFLVGGLAMAVHSIGHHIHLISATHITMYGDHMKNTVHECKVDTTDEILQKNLCYNPLQGNTFPSEMNQAVHPSCGWTFWKITFMKRKLYNLIISSFPGKNVFFQ